MSASAATIAATAVTPAAQTAVNAALATPPARASFASAAAYWLVFR